GESPGTDLFERRARRVSQQPELGDVERERGVSAAFEPGRGADERGVALAAELIQRRRPFGTGERVDPFAIQLPVARVPGIETLQKGFARDEIRLYGRWRAAQRIGDEIVVQQVGERTRGPRRGQPTLVERT